MLHEKMLNAINEQMNHELYSSYLYLSMSAYFESVNLKGCAHWMRIQTMEEQTHFKRFYDFATARGGRVVLAAIEAPPVEWNSALAVFEDGLAHERIVTGKINQLVDVSLELKDHATNSFLHWFVDEQVEEEATADEIVQSLKLSENDATGLFMIDKDLGTRSFAPPPGVTL